MEDNPIFKFLKEHFPTIATFIGTVLLAWSPLLGKAFIDRWTGKQKGENDTSAAGVAQSLITGASELQELSAKLIDGMTQLHAAELAEKDAKYTRLEQEVERLRKQDRKEFERVKSEMRTAYEKIERQNVKLREQLERVRNELAQKKREAETWRNQIIDDFHGTPRHVPIVVKGDE